VGWARVNPKYHTPTLVHFYRSCDCYTKVTRSEEEESSPKKVLEGTATGEKPSYATKIYVPKTAFC